MANILVVAAHPDDEVLGCGGTIARHVAEGDRVRVVIMAEGLTSRPDVAGCALSELHSAAHKSGEILGVAATFLEGLPDNRLDSLERLEVVRRIEAHVNAWQPAIVYTHHAGDVNIDHQIVHHAVVTACRPQAGHPVKTLLYFEVPSSTEWQTPGSCVPFAPNWFVEIAPHLGTKLSAMAAYRTELRAWPHPRSIEGITHLARWRGCVVGTEAAEAFILGRKTLFVAN